MLPGSGHWQLVVHTFWFDKKLIDVHVSLGHNSRFLWRKNFTDLDRIIKIHVCSGFREPLLSKAEYMNTGKDIDF